jgi:hypothetical protein
VSSPFGVTLKKTQAQTGLIFSTSGLNSMKTLKGEGACCAIIADWIRQSKKLGRSVKSLTELSPSTSYVVAFGPEDFKNKITPDWDINVMESFSLNPQEVETWEPVNFSTVSVAIASHAGYQWLRIYGASGGHSLGFFVGNSAFEYMDPNEGLYRFSTAAAFTSLVVSKWTTLYNDLKNWARLYDFA